MFKNNLKQEGSSLRFVWWFHLNRLGLWSLTAQQSGEANENLWMEMRCEWLYASLYDRGDEESSFNCNLHESRHTSYFWASLCLKSLHVYVFDSISRCLVTFLWSTSFYCVSVQTDKAVEARIWRGARWLMLLPVFEMLPIQSFM